MSTKFKMIWNNKNIVKKAESSISINEKNIKIIKTYKNNKEKVYNELESKNEININIKKSIIKVIAIIFLIALLYITKEGIEIIPNNYVYAKEASSSTNTNTASNGADMTMLLAKLINGEAEGESYKGKVAVGAVVLNRVKSSEFPNTISGVIYQKGQFSCVTDGNFNKAITKEGDAYKAAKEALDGADPTGGALYFYNPNTTKSKWLFTLKTLTTIGKHRFSIET